jgi:hypothetical protein
MFYYYFGSTVIILKKFTALNLCGQSCPIFIQILFVNELLRTPHSIFMMIENRVPVIMFTIQAY